MDPIGVSAAIGLELLATAGLVLLASRVYERAILRTDAPVRLRVLLLLIGRSEWARWNAPKPSR